MADKHDVATTVEELKELIKSLHGDAEKVAGELTFNNKEPYATCLISLYLSLLELTSSFIDQLERGSHVLIPANIRSLLETFVEFENLRKDRAYIESMEYYHLSNQITVLERAKKQENQFLKDIGELENIDDVIKDHKDRKNVLRKRKARYLKIFQRFKKAGLIEWYNGLYGFLSENTHASLGSIFYRHFERDGDNIYIVYGKQLPPERMLPHVDLSAGLLLDTSKNIHALYGKNKDDNPYEAYDGRLGKLREKYS